MVGLYLFINVWNSSGVSSSPFSGFQMYSEWQPSQASWQPVMVKHNEISFGTSCKTTSQLLNLNIAVIPSALFKLPVLGEIGHFFQITDYPCSVINIPRIAFGTMIHRMFIDVSAIIAKCHFYIETEVIT